MKKISLSIGEIVILITIINLIWLAVLSNTKEQHQKNIEDIAYTQYSLGLNTKQHIYEDELKELVDKNNQVQSQAYKKGYDDCSNKLSPIIKKYEIMVGKNHQNIETLINRITLNK